LATRLATCITDRNLRCWVKDSGFGFRASGLMIGGEDSGISVFRVFRAEGFGFDGMGLGFKV